MFFTLFYSAADVIIAYPTKAFATTASCENAKPDPNSTDRRRYQIAEDAAAGTLNQHIHRCQPKLFRSWEQFGLYQPDEVKSSTSPVSTFASKLSCHPITSCYQQRSSSTTYITVYVGKAREYPAAITSFLNKHNLSG
jgi:hypothetical protein